MTAVCLPLRDSLLWKGLPTLTPGFRGARIHPDRFFYGIDDAVPFGSVVFTVGKPVADGRGGRVIACAARAERLTARAVEGNPRAIGAMIDAQGKARREGTATVHVMEMLDKNRPWGLDLLLADIQRVISGPPELAVASYRGLRERVEKHREALSDIEASMEILDALVTEALS